MEVLFNELSLQHPRSDKHVARESMGALMQILARLFHAGVSKTLHVSRGLMSRELAPGYMIIQWMNDPEVPREHRALLKTITTRGPYLTIMMSKEEEKRHEALEFYFQ